MGFDNPAAEWRYEMRLEERRQAEYREWAERRENAVAASFAKIRKLHQDIIQATLRLINKKSYQEDFTLIAQNFSTWKHLLLEDKQFEIENITDKSKASSRSNLCDLYALYDLMVDLLQFKSFTFQDNIITKRQLASFLDYAHEAIRTESVEDNLYLKKLSKFCNRLNAETLNTDALDCLRCIIKDFTSRKLLGTSNMITNRLTLKLNQTITLSQDNSLIQPNSPNETSFQMKMSQYIDQEFNPYMRVMSPKTLTFIKSKKDIGPIVKFILERHNHETCSKDPIYAPNNKISKDGVKQHLLDTLDTEEKEYSKVSACNAAIEKISILHTELEQDLNTYLGFFWRQTISNQIRALETLKSKIIEKKEKIEYPNVAVESFRESHAQILTGTFFVKRTSRLLDEIAIGGAVPTENRRSLA